MGKEPQSDHEMLPAKQLPLLCFCPSTQVAEDCGSVICVIFLTTEREKETGYKFPRETTERVLEASAGKVTWTLAGGLGGKQQGGGGRTGADLALSRQEGRWEPQGVHRSWGAHAEFVQTQKISVCEYCSGCGAPSSFVLFLWGFL